MRMASPTPAGGDEASAGAGALIAGMMTADGGAPTGKTEVDMLVETTALALPSLPRFLLACALMVCGVVLPLGFFLARSRAKGGTASVRQRLV